MKPRMTWAEKLTNDQGLPPVMRISGKRCRRWGQGTVVIPAPREVDQRMRRVAEGHQIVQPGPRCFVIDFERALPPIPTR